MVVHVGFLSVPGLFLVQRMVVAMDEGVVVMLVRRPVLAVLPRVYWVVGVMIGDVIVVVHVGSGGMGMLGLLAAALGVLVPFAC
jgi:hypothetical protein